MKISDFLVLYGGRAEIMPKLVRKFWLIVFRALYALQRKQEKPGKVYLIASELTQQDLAELALRFEFYVPVLRRVELVERSYIDLSVLLSPAPLLVFGPRNQLSDWLILRRPGAFDVDFRTNPMDGWAWTGLADYLGRDRINFSLAHKRLSERITTLKQQARTRCYIFGTGPSLATAMDRRWDDGYRIVCNTIVRDSSLWDYLKPDFIVAGDAIYHFGHTRFARAFRRDLRARLESTDTFFVYPAQFHAIVARELAGLEERLIPVPSGWRRAINIDLTRSFKLPNLGNVLGLLLLPLACTLSKRVYLWGFDGRAPDDKLFWSNSSKHSYPEYVEELQKAHPRFFEYHVPASDPNKYIRSVQGDGLELCLQLAEKRGWHFVMMHPSWTATLQKRYLGEN